MGAGGVQFTPACLLGYALDLHPACACCICLCVHGDLLCASVVCIQTGEVHFNVRVGLAKLALDASIPSATAYASFLRVVLYCFELALGLWLPYTSQVGHVSLHDCGVLVALGLNGELSLLRWTSILPCLALPSLALPCLLGG